MIFDADAIDIFSKFLLNVFVLLVLLRYVYFKIDRDRDLLFGFFLFGQGVYFISALMHDVEISMGFAFGLFAVLSMLRYRTESISVRDMTYLFIVIVISLMFAVAPISIPYLLLINGLLCAIAALAETEYFAPRVSVQRVIYDRVDAINLKNMEVLKNDLATRLGCSILSVEVREIDLIRDCATINVTYSSKNLRDKSSPI